MRSRPTRWMLSTLALLAAGCVSPNRNAPPIDHPVVARPSIPVAPSSLDRSRLDDLVRTTHAEAGLTETRCYRFDQPYFAEIRFNAGRSVTESDTTSLARMQIGIRAGMRDGRLTPHPELHYFADSVQREYTALIRLEPDSRFVPVFTLPEVSRSPLSLSRPRYSWQLLADSVLDLSATNGHLGPIFNLTIRADSLSGTVVHWTHVTERDSVTGKLIARPQLPAHAVRVACPS